MKSMNFIRIEATKSFTQCAYIIRSFHRSAANKTPTNPTETTKIKLKLPKWAEADLVPFQKDFSHLIDVDRSLTSEAVEQFRNSNKISLEGENLSNPIRQFSDIKFPKYIEEWLKRTNFEKPTIVQAQSWSLILNGNHFIGNGPTGSGKTLGYLLPGLIHLEQRKLNTPNVKPTMLVVAPTCELAEQIKNVVDEITEDAEFDVFLAANLGYDYMKGARKNADICIATPKRLCHLIRTEQINIRQCSYLVLDEVDALLNTKFRSQTTSIIQQSRPDKQIVMFSASPLKDQKKILTFAKNSTAMSVGLNQHTASDSVKQDFIFCSLYEMESRLMDIIESYKNEKVIIFVNSEAAVKELYNMLHEENIQVSEFYGKSYRRDVELRDFRSGATKVLVSSDLGARGIDIPDVKLVINYEMPGGIVDYINRIGRTGRGTNRGRAISFIIESNLSVAGDLQNLLRRSGQDVPAPLEKFAKLHALRKEDAAVFAVHKYF